MVKDRYIIKKVNIIIREEELQKPDNIMKLQPIFKEKIWGGKSLMEEFAYPLEGENIGECWGVSAHANGDCLIRSGKYKGWTLSYLWKKHREQFGDYAAKDFPLMVKIIDAEDDLSVQVHPDDTYARKVEHEPYGKSECWFVLNCEEDASIINGHTASNKEELINRIEKKQWNHLLNEVPIKKGDFVQINPGTVHAIKKNTMLLEIQQSSDLTYRVYDYDRLCDGKPRDLHLDKALDVIDTPSKHMDVVSSTTENPIQDLIDSAYYSVFKIDITDSFTILQKSPFLLVSVIDGQGFVNGEAIEKGEFFIAPYGEKEYEFSGDLKIVIAAAK